MDALSISVAAATVAVSCGKVTCSLKNFVDDVKNIHVKVESFRIEVSSLEKILISIGTSLKAYPTNTADPNAPLWSSIKRSLDDCEATVQRLESELNKIKQRSQNIWHKSCATVRLNMYADNIKTLRSQIHTHIGALQMSFSCISVCLLLELPGRSASGALQNAATINELSTQIEGLRMNIQKVEALLQSDRAGEGDLRSNIETIKIAATDLVTSATSVATLSSDEQSVPAVQLQERGAGDRVRPWLTHARNSLGSEAASSYTSTESTGVESIFSEPEGPVTSPTSEGESVVPLPLKARGRVAPGRGGGYSIAADNSSLRRRDHQDDGDLSIVLSMMGKWEKSAQAKLKRSDLAGAHQDLRTVLDCRDRVSSSEFANNRVLVVLQKLIQIGGQYLEQSQFGESEPLFKFVVDRGSQMSADTSDSLRGDIVARAGTLALAQLDLCNLQGFEKFSGITKLHLGKIVDDKTRIKESNEFALQVANTACEVARRRLDEDSHDPEACDKLCRIALQYGSSIGHADTNISEVSNEVIEKNIGTCGYHQAEALAEQAIEYGRQLPPDLIHQADLGRTVFNLAFSCYSQRTEEKLAKAELVMSTSEEWQGSDAHLVHDTCLLLARTYWKKGNLIGAENCCWTALKGRMELHGDEHENYLEAVDLFVRILRKQGQSQEATLHAIQLTPEYRNNAAARWCSLHTAYECKDDVLKRALKGGYQEAVNVLISEGARFEDLFRRTASGGDVETARMLLAAGGLSRGHFNHSSKTAASNHPIALADHGGRTEILQLLLENALSIDDCAATYNLNWAVREQRVVAITALLNLGARADEKTNGTTVLHLAAKSGWLPSLQALLRAKPSLEVTDSSGATPLHVAVMRGHGSIVKELLDAGADIESRKESFTPLHLAISGHMNNLIQSLLERGASPVAESDNGINALHLAVMGNDRPIVADLVGRCPTLLKSQNSDGRNALHIALTLPDDEMALLLINRDIDVNAKTSSGETAYDLLRQSKSKHKTLEKLLLSKMHPKPSRFLRFSGSGFSKPEANALSTTTSRPGFDSGVTSPYPPPNQPRIVPINTFMLALTDTPRLSRSSTLPVPVQSASSPQGKEPKI